MAHVPGLRSPHARVGRLVYFGRMLDKIRLHASGTLPPEYHENLGDQRHANVFDARCCRFLGVSFADLTARVLAGGTDEEILAWAHAQGTPRTDEACEIWCAFMLKRGWRDGVSALVRQRIEQFGLQGRPIETMFDVLDWDEGRDPAEERARAGL